MHSLNGICVLPAGTTSDADESPVAVFRHQHPDVFWRYFNMRDYITCSLGVVIGQVLSSLVVLLLRWHVPMGFLALNAILAIGGIVVFRLVFRHTFLILTDAGRVESRKRLLIVGAGSAADSLRPYLYC